MFEYYLERAVAYYWDWFPNMMFWYLVIFTLLFLKVLFDQFMDKRSTKIKVIDKEVSKN